MKRTLQISLLFLTVATFAVGPKIPCILTFAPSPSPETMGYFFYWRSESGAYTDTQRWAMPTNAATGYDLRVIGLPKGKYYVAASATNANTESDLSVEIPWIYQNPNKPGNLAVSPP